MTGPVLLCGIPSEPPLQMVAAALARRGVPHHVWNQRRLPLTDIELEVAAGVVSGVLVDGDERVPLHDLHGVYVRTTELASIPEVVSLNPGDPLARQAEQVNDQLAMFFDLSGAVVVNRLRAMPSNASKPFQLQAIAGYFDVPDTLVTNDPDDVRAFWSAHGRVVYKSISGIRSIVHELTEADAGRLERLRWCPAQFQELIDGIDVRVHTVGSACVFATAIVSEVIDWRYAHHGHGEAMMEPIAVSDEVAERCLSLAAALGLEVAGIDLKVADDGRIVCLEVNPSPAFSAFEVATHQPIADAIAAHLSGDRRPP